MFVKRMYYPVRVLGPGKRVGIWVAGCNRRCPGCMSPELQTTSGCNDLSVEEIGALLKSIREPIDGVTISGGEPFLQAKELCELVRLIRSRVTEDILVYTGYTLAELRKMQLPYVDETLSQIAVLIDGEYIDELNDGVGMRGSSNQTVHVFRNCRDYSSLSTGKRALQTIRYKGQILVIGIQ